MGVGLHSSWDRSVTARSSCSIIHAGLRALGRSIGTFSLDAGIVLNPNKNRLLCSYTKDAGLDYNGNRESCHRRCPSQEAGWIDLSCSFSPNDLHWMLQTHARHGEREGGIGSYRGYNEVVVDAGVMRNNLPSSIDAFFIFACHNNQQNTGVSWARNCQQARSVGIDLYHKFIHRWQLSEREFPLLEFHRDNWEAPFSYFQG